MFDVELSTEERNLLSMAYKNVIVTRRASWRVLSSFETREADANANSPRLAKLAEYKSKVESEMCNICNEILSVIERLIPTASTPESQVFFYKMKGDYYRYLAEFVKDDFEVVTKEAMKSYQEAQQIAKTSLPVTHPVRLGLAFNFSVFYYETLNDPEKATQLASQTFEDAIHELETLSDNDSRESRLILRFIRDNLSIWNPEPIKSEASGENPHSTNAQS